MWATPFLAVDLGTAERLHRDLFAHRLGDYLRPVRNMRESLVITTSR